MQESEKLGNQQATKDLGWLAGILDGEGSIILGMQSRKDGERQVYHRICFYNTDDSIINKVVKILDDNEIKCYVSERDNYGGLGKRKGFTVTISSYESAVKLLELVKNDLTAKKDRAEILLRFCYLRMNHLNKAITNEEKEILNSWESSTTKSTTPKGEDIV